MRTFLLAGLLVLSLASSSWALRLTGEALSDSGVYVRLVSRVHQVGSGLVGTLRCRPGSAPCAFGRGHVSLTAYADGSFQGGMQSARLACAFVGVVVPGQLEGRYGCDNGDTGSFAIGR